MGFFTRMSNGWELAKMSLETIKNNKSLLVFPVLTTTSLVLIIGSFVGGGIWLFGDKLDVMLEGNSSALPQYAIVFLFYLINFFIVIFFNTGLIHCAMESFEGRETGLGDGIRFATTKLDKILGWTLVSATVGLLLEVIANMGKAGEIVQSLIGLAWSVLTFFVVPVLIYEDKGVIEAIKDSGRIMKDKWGESLTMNMSFGLFQILGIVLSAGLGFLLAQVHPILGIAIGVIAGLSVITVFAAAKVIFTAAVYNQVKGKPTGVFISETLDSAFITK
jgi:hypothetical protein